MTAIYREFATGATRDQDETKLDFEGFLSPLVLVRFAQYMRVHRQTPQGLRESDNWQKGIPQEAYMKSLLRHAVEVWSHHRGSPVVSEPTMAYSMEEGLCAIIFNAQGMLHEILKGDRGIGLPAMVPNRENQEMEDESDPF